MNAPRRTARMLWSALLLLAVVGASPCWAYPQPVDFTDRALADFNTNYVDNLPGLHSYGRGVRVQFNLRDRFIYHWYPAHGLDNEDGWTFYRFRGVHVPIPNYVCNVRMALEAEQHYFDHQFGDVPTRRTPLEIHFVPTGSGNVLAFVQPTFTRDARGNLSLGPGWMVIHPTMWTTWGGRQDPVATSLHEYFHIVQCDRWPQALNEPALVEGTAEWAVDEPIPLTMWRLQHPVVTNADDFNEYAGRQRYFEHTDDSFFYAGNGTDRQYRSVFFWKLLGEQATNSNDAWAIRRTLENYRARIRDFTEELDRAYQQVHLSKHSPE